MAAEVDNDETGLENDDCISFSDEPKSQKIKVGATSYLLKEMMGPDVGKWQAYDASRIKMSKGGKVDMAPDAFKEYSATLINLCTFDDENKNVSKKVIMAWPASAINGIFEICQTMNALNAEGKEEAKKA